MIITITFLVTIQTKCYIFKINDEPISKLLKGVTPAKVGAQKRAENTGSKFSPELQQQTFEIGPDERVIFLLPYNRSC